MPSNKTCTRTSTQRAGLARTGVGGVIVGSRNTLSKKDFNISMGQHLAGDSEIFCSFKIDAPKCPCYISTVYPCCMSMLHVHAACPCCMSMLHVLAACPRCMSTLHVHVACPCCMSTLHVHAACPCCRSTLHVHVACPCCMSLLQVCIGSPHCLFVMLVHAACKKSRMSILHASATGP